MQFYGIAFTIASYKKTHLMKHIIILTLILVLPICGRAQNEKMFNTELEEVTVYLEGALITRIGEINISSGKSTIIAKDLSPQIDEQSIQVKGYGDFKILSVNKRIDYSEELRKPEKVKLLNEQIEKIEAQVKSKNSRLDILAEKRSLLNENKKLGGQNSGVSLIQLQQAIQFYDKELSFISEEEIKLENEINELEQRIEKLNKDLANRLNEKYLPSGQVIIKVDAQAATNAKFEINYLITNAGWYPKYDVRVEDITQKMSLTYKAQVYQNSGINWKDVNLRLSNGNPNKSGVVPELETWYLNYVRNTIYRPNYGRNRDNKLNGVVVDSETGKALPGVNVLIIGSTIGTITDLQGRFELTIPQNASHLRFSFIGMKPKVAPINDTYLRVEMEPDVQQLSEVVVTGYAKKALQGKVAGVSISKNEDREANSISTSVRTNQTTVDFEVEEPYSLSSGGEAINVELKTYNIDAQYSYYAVPKIDDDAFLVAEVTKWDQFSLLEGEANLYFEDRYVGRSILNPESFEDTLNISLGRDKSIVIRREKIQDFTKRQVIGGNKVESRAYKISVSNQKQVEIKLNVYDQIPVAAINAIDVEATQLSKGNLNEATGEVHWELKFPPQSQQELKIGYEVKYSKHENVRLE
jgi:prefoldin subunit 5